MQTQKTMKARDDCTRKATPDTDTYKHVEEKNENREASNKK